MINQLLTFCEIEGEFLTVKLNIPTAESFFELQKYDPSIAAAIFVSRCTGLSFEQVKKMAHRDFIRIYTRLHKWSGIRV